MRTAVVIGGGVAGPVAAMALQRIGFDAVVYEARPEIADDVGAFLTLQVNGVDALRAVGLGEAVAGLGFRHRVDALPQWQRQAARRGEHR